MEEFDPSIIKLIEEVAKKYPDDIASAVDEADERLRSMPVFATTVNMLIRTALRRLIHEYRHEVNRQAKRKAGEYGKPPKTNYQTARTAAAYQCIYDKYYIGGNLLGDLRGNQLGMLASVCVDQARGDLFNRDLLNWLNEHGVIGDRRVRDVFKTVEQQERLDEEFSKLYQKAMGRRIA